MPNVEEKENYEKKTQFIFETEHGVFFYLALCNRKKPFFSSIS